MGYVVAQHVRVANRQLRRPQDYIVESADDVAAASQERAADRGPPPRTEEQNKRWPPAIGRQPNKKFRMYACARMAHEIPREWASKHCQRVWKAVCSTARQWSLINRSRRRSGQFLPTAACAAVCPSVTNPASSETPTSLDTSANTHTGIRDLTQLTYASTTRARPCQRDLNIA